MLKHPNYSLNELEIAFAQTKDAKFDLKFLISFNKLRNAPKASGGSDLAQ